MFVCLFFTVFVEDGHATEDGSRAAPALQGRQDEQDQVARRYPHI